MAEKLRGIGYSSDELIKTTDYASQALLGRFIPQAKAEKRSLSRWLSQRHVLLLVSFIGAFSTLIINVVTTIVFHYQYGTKTVPGDEPALFIGDCGAANRLGSALHAIINILSTIMLMASNLCMQLLQAPSRAQIDLAHRNGRWLDIGIPSIRNFRYVGLPQKLTWMLLVLSSLPLHFLYNSAIYNTLPAWQKQVWLGTPEFLNNGPCNTSATDQLLQQRSNRQVYAMSQSSLETPHTSMKEMGIGSLGDLAGDITNEQCASREASLTPSYVETLSNLTALDCLTRYSRTFTNDSYLYMISSYDLLDHKSLSNSSNTLLYFGQLSLREISGFNYPSWRCGNTNTFDCRNPKLWEEDPKLVENWNVLMYKIDYCLSAQASLGGLCSVRYSPSILIAVCCANLGKVIGIVLTAWISVLERSTAASGSWFRFSDKVRQKNRENLPLATMGDVIESFLADPDPKWRGGCLDGRANLLDKHDRLKTKSLLSERNRKRLPKIKWLEYLKRLRYVGWIRKMTAKVKAALMDPGKTPPRVRRWYGSASTARWAWTVIPYMVVLGSGIGFLVQSVGTVYGRVGSRGYVFSMSWGAADQNAIGLLSLDINRRPSQLRTAIIMFANMWHWLLSLLYIQVNSLLTCMCAEEEWQSYAKKRKSLRVTSPRGLQRSTYFVSLPLRYGLPFQVAFPLAHWTLSQGVFLIVTQGFWQGDAEYDGTSSLPFLAFSFWPIFTTILIGIGIISGVGVISMKRHPNVMPMGATCSAVISAACHPPIGDDEAYLFPVRWGYVPLNTNSSSGDPGDSDDLNRPPQDDIPFQGLHSDDEALRNIAQPGREAEGEVGARQEIQIDGSSTTPDEQQWNEHQGALAPTTQESPSSARPSQGCEATDQRVATQDPAAGHFTFTTFVHAKWPGERETYPDLCLRHSCAYHYL